MDKLLGEQWIIQELNKHVRGLIVEGLGIRQTTFGNNYPLFDNMEVTSSDELVRFAKYKTGFGKNMIYTFFKDNDILVLVFFSKTPKGYYLGFTTTKINENLPKDANLILPYMSFSPIEGDSFSVFGKVMFVCSIIAKKYNINSFSVLGTDYTNKIYERMKTNKPFIQTMDTYGWKLIPLEAGFKLKRK